MKHTIDEFNELSLNISENIGEQEVITGALANMVSMFSETIAEGISHEDKISELSDENNRLKDANMNLYLKVAQITPNEEYNKKVEKEKMTYEELFDEKGELK